MESEVTFYTIADKKNSLMLVNNAIVYCADANILADFLKSINQDLKIVPASFSILESSATENNAILCEIQLLGGSFELQQVILFGSKIVH